MSSFIEKVNEMNNRQRNHRIITKKSITSSHDVSHHTISKQKHTFTYEFVMIVSTMVLSLTTHFMFVHKDSKFAHIGHRYQDFNFINDMLQFRKQGNRD